MDDINERIQDAYKRSVLGINEMKTLSVPEKHQLAVAKKTLSYSDAGANIMGGMSKKEAIEFLKKIGYSDTRIKKMSEETTNEDTELSETSEVEFKEFDVSKQKFITNLVGKGREKNQSYFSGIHGTIVNLHGQGMDNMRFNAKDLKKIANNKDVRWVDISSIAMGYNTEKDTDK